MADSSLDRRFQRIVAAMALCIFLGFSGCRSGAADPGADPSQYSIHKRVVAKNGAIATAHPLATDVGAMILKAGGNAVDAAVAAQFALAVVYPVAGNIGGGGFMIIHSAKGQNTAIDFREEAPRAATRDMYLDTAGNADPERSRNGALSVGIPGTISGLFLAHDQYGAMPMKKLIQPAIDLARKGFILTTGAATRLNAAQDAFRRYNRRPNAFIRDGGWHAGDTLVQTDLAHTLTLIRDHGAAGFYRGETAKKIVAEMKRGGGLISLDDLRNYQAIERDPVMFDYRGYQVVSMPLPSSGGILLAQMLGMLSPFPVKRYGFESVRSVQLMTEIERRAYADRAKYLGDPDFVKVPVDSLVSTDYLRRRMKDYHPGRATPSRAVSAGVIPWESDETTHLSVADSAGNAVAVTYTLNNYFGSKVVVGNAGFFLNDEMDDFSAKPGAPNMFGLLGAEANAIAPHKRMLSSMTPTIILRKGRPFLVLGTPGGATIITSVFQTIVDLIDFDLSVSDAVNKPKFHEQWKPEAVEIERGFPDSVVTAMQQMGYSFKQVGSIGRTEVIRIGSDSVEAVADHRGDDAAAGY